jgi:limonene-1,2-epoxide hydrolase
MPVSPEPGPTLGPRAVGVLQARDGQILTWRKYQDTLAITQALSRPPPEPH